LVSATKVSTSDPVDVDNRDAVSTCRIIACSHRQTPPTASATARRTEPTAKSISADDRPCTPAAIEATIPYQEPPYWYYPVGQSLGAALLAAGKPDDAREAFRAALLRGPGNAWALWGLARAEAALGHTLESRAADAAFDRAWLGGKTLPELDRL
jgi:hypothetical protein